MEQFRINNNITFEDEETKVEYQKYLDEINEYNKKIANGETPEKDLTAITDEFKEKFIIKSQNKEPQEKSTNELDDLIKKIDDKLNIPSENNSIDEQIKDIDKRIVEIEKIENDSVNSVPNSLKSFISFDSDGYAFAEQKIPVELEIEYDKFINKYYNSEDNKIVNNIVNKIIELPYNVETTISELINYKPEEGFVSPLTQGIISNAVLKKCENNGINLIKIKDGFEGLAYNYKFKKIGLDESENVNINNEFKIENYSFDDEEKNVEQIIISDLEFGNITINTITGKIDCDNMKHDKKRLYNDFPIEYSMNEIQIYDLKYCNLEECKNLFVDNLHLIFDIRNEIEEKVIQEIWNWFSVDFTPETLKQQFLKLRINVTIYLYDGEYINLGTSWVFEEEYSDINSGYADFNVDINSKNIECTDIGFF